MFSNVSWLCWLVFSDCFQCFCFLLLSSSLIVVGSGCGVCSAWFHVVLSCFTMFLVSCFNLCFVVSTFFMMFQTVWNRCGLFQFVLCCCP